MIEPRQLPDAQVRSRIETDLETNLLIEAGAGSGKTYCLVQRCLALILAGRVRTAELAAITFTRKAAAQLRARLTQALAEAAAAMADPALKERLRQARRELPQAFIGTIHAFCAHLLRRCPLAAGVDPGFVEMDESEGRRDAEAYFYREMERLHLAGDPRLAAWAEEGEGLAPLKDAFLQLLDYPEVAVPGGQAPPADWDGFRQTLAGLLARLQPLLSQRPAAGGDDPLAEKLRSARRRLELGLLSQRRLALDCAEKLAAPVKVTLNRWPSREAAKEAQAAVESFAEKYATPFIQAVRQARYAEVLALVRPALESYRRERCRAGRLHYQDLLFGAARLLREVPRARLALQREYRVLLVDEFQDVDPLQAEVVFFLAARQPNEKDWTKLQLRPGALFAVGDPKQSIYRFRRADIAIYQQARRCFAEQGAVLSLTANFRSAPELADFVNRAFDGHFPPEASAVQAAFAPQQAVSPPMPAALTGVRRLAIAAVDSRRGADLARQEASQIAAWIEGAIASGQYQAGDFLLLTYAKRHLSYYAAELERRGLAVAVSGFSQGEMPDEIGELLRLLRFLADPQQGVLLLAVLRGLFFGLSDDELYRAARRRGPLAFNRAWLTPEGDEAVDRAFGTLKRWWQWSRSRPGDAALEGILKDSGLWEFCRGQPSRRPAAGLLSRLVRRARAAAGGEFAAMVEALEAETLAEEAGGDEEAGSAVRVMNLHKAKGLEARVVFLCAPLRQAPHPPRRHVRRAGQLQEGYFALCTEHGEYQERIVAQPPGWEKWQAAEQQFAAAEALRLLYVAATRAGQLLVIGRAEGAGAAGPWAHFSPYLEGAEELPPPPAGGARVWSPPAAETSPLDLTGLAAPSYYLRSASALNESSGAPLPWEEGGQGASWGRAAHRALEAAFRGISGPELAAWCRHILVEEGRRPSEAGELSALLQTFFSSPLWRRAMAASERLVELPLARHSDENGVPVLLQGVADLLFREADGWVLVDYKSDRVTPQNRQALIEHYRPQLAAYARLFAESSGQKVKERFIYFLQEGREVPG